MQSLKRAILAVTIVFFTLPVMAQEQSIQIKGSDTMVNLGQAWAETFMGQNPDALIAVTGGGSGTGIAALINGSCDIAQSSRNMSQKEYELAKSKGIDVTEISVGIDAIAFVVHPDNPVQEVTIDQLSGIYTGHITNWKELGGADEPILVLSRERNSGTHVYVLEEVVRKGVKENKSEFAPSILMMPSSQAIEQEVATGKTAIGYFGLGYLNPRVRSLKVLNPKTGQHVAPTIEDATSGNYPVSRPLKFYLPGEATGLVKQFVDFVLSDKGQFVVLEMQFVPLPKEAVKQGTV